MDVNKSAQVVTVLVVDDETTHRQSLAKILQREGFRTLEAEDGKQALHICRNHHVHVVVTDLMMPEMNGIELVRALQTVAPDVEIVVMTAHGTIETAVEAMREGAYDFVEKPLKRVTITRAIFKAAEKHDLVIENRSLKKQLSTLNDRSVVGNSAALRRALDTADQAAASSANVLLLGESGTGKELLARRIHKRSGRTGTFVSVNLAALPETIVESELFGHEKGAFTGATAKRQGRIMLADGGTLFLDEIGELSANVQVKLLRVLQEGVFDPLGGKPQKADFRLVAATNRNLHDEVAAGRFREDLYYRLNVIAITSPPLADRKEDIPLLVDHFLEVYRRKNDKNHINFSEQALQQLVNYDWPGNVRELENVIERAVVLNQSGTITLTDLPEAIAKANPYSDEVSFSVGTPLAVIERIAIEKTLNKTAGDKNLAAKLLGISARTIYRKLEDSAREDDATHQSLPHAMQ